MQCGKFVEVDYTQKRFVRRFNTVASKSQMSLFSYHSVDLERSSNAKQRCFGQISIHSGDGKSIVVFQSAGTAGGRLTTFTRNDNGSAHNVH